MSPASERMKVCVAFANVSATTEKYRCQRYTVKEEQMGTSAQIEPKQPTRNDFLAEPLPSTGLLQDRCLDQNTDSATSKQLAAYRNDILHRHAAHRQVDHCVHCTETRQCAHVRLSQAFRCLQKGSFSKRHECKTAQKHRNRPTKKQPKPGRTWDDHTRFAASASTIHAVPKSRAGL